MVAKETKLLTGLGCGAAASYRSGQSTAGGIAIFAHVEHIRSYPQGLRQLSRLSLFVAPAVVLSERYGFGGPDAASRAA